MSAQYSRSLQNLSSGKVTLWLAHSILAAVNGITNLLLVLQVGSVSIGKEKGGRPSVLVSQPGGTFLRIYCNTPSTNPSSSSSDDTLNEQNINMDDLSLDDDEKRWVVGVVQNVLIQTVTSIIRLAWVEELYFILLSIITFLKKIQQPILWFLRFFFFFLINYV
jgi:hypothetical protein